MGLGDEQDRVMRGALLLALALAAPCGAQPVTVAPWMTGEWLVDLYNGGDLSGIQGSYGHFTREDRIEVQRRIAKERAEAYVSGIHDATEGKQWCYNPSKPKPSTLQEEVFWGLRALPADQLKRNASDLIVELWRRKWPCGGKP
jgi:hypothetical protein